MKKAIATLCYGDLFSEMAKVSHPTMKSYADRCGADFVVLGKRIFHENIHGHWEKLQVSRLLHRYDQVVYLDTDILVASDAPSIFDVVPMDVFGAMNEGKHFERTKYLIEGAVDYGIDVKIRDTTPYYNLGVMIFGKIHVEVFSLPSVLMDGGMPEQTYTNLRLLQTKTWMQDIGMPFNGISAPWHDPKNPDAHFVHFAGWHLGREAVASSMREHLEAWKSVGRAG